MNFLQKKLRSLVKRTGVIPLVNASDTYVVQHLPEWIGRQSFDFGFLRKLWTRQNTKNDEADLIRLCFFIEHLKLLEKEQVPGSLAELGVYKGTTAKILHSMMPHRNLYLFDTFEGFDKRDVQHEKKKISASSFFDDTSLERVRDFVGISSNIKYCKGYFPTTTMDVPENERFALVHLDADLYKPTHDALHFFYPKMSPGGIMVFHDYSSHAWPGVTQAVDEFFKDKPESLVLLPDKSGTALIRKMKSI